MIEIKPSEEQLIIWGEKLKVALQIEIGALKNQRVVSVGSAKEDLEIGGSVKGNLEESLVATGRANATPNPKGELGGAQDDTARKKSEASSRKVLDMMESGTRANQQEHNELTGQTAPLSHAVSGHGEGTDQFSRLLDGRRNDELIEEAKAMTRELEEKSARVLAIGKQITETDESHLKDPPTDDVVEEWQQDKPRLEEERKELAASIGILEKRLTTKVKFTNPTLGEIEIPLRETVGDDPNNTSGAFSTNLGMLHVVNEAFSQANMVTSHRDAQAREKEEIASEERYQQELIDAVAEKRAPRKKTELDQLAALARTADPLGKGAPKETDSFSANIKGPSGTVIEDKDAEKRTAKKEELGYNLNVEGYLPQSEGLGLAHDEMQKRFESIKKTGGLENARVVLNPAYVDGKRVGYNLQTAYANSDEASASYAKPEELAGTLLGAETELNTLKSQLAKLKSNRDTAKSELKKKESSLAGEKKGLENKESQIGRGVCDPSGRDEQTLASKLEAKKEKLKKTPSSEKQKRKEIEAEIKKLTDWIKYANLPTEVQQHRDGILRLEGEIGTAKGDVKTAELEVTKAEQAVAAAVITVNELKPKRPPGEAVPKAATAGYDPITGTWKGERPEKPKRKDKEGKDILKGKDEEDNDLTAHHLYPWNKIRGDLDKALKGDAGKLQKLLDFAEVDAPSWFFEELAKEPQDRDYRFSEEINRIAADICWSPKNVMMGPLGEKRGDDPHESLDVAFTKGGLPTPQSMAAKLTDDVGGIGATPTESNAKIKQQIEARHLKKAKVDDISKLNSEQLGKLKQELVNANVWEAVREDFPRAAAEARRKAAIDAKYTALIKKYTKGGKGPEDMSEEDTRKMLIQLKQFEEGRALKKLTERAPSPEEKKAFEAKMQGLGEGYDEAKAAFLKDKGKKSDAELSEQERSELGEKLSKGHLGPRQRLAENFTKKARQQTDRERKYDKNEWVTGADKLKRRVGMVKAPPGLGEIMTEVDQALKLVVKGKPAPQVGGQKKGKGAVPTPAPTLLPPTKDAYDAPIKNLSAMRTKYLKALKTYRKRKSVPVSDEDGAARISGAEMLSRYPMAEKIIDQIRDRIAHLFKKKASAPE